jgi:hypothetical protein
MNSEYSQRCSLQLNQADRLGIYVAAGTHADFAAGRSFESSTSGGNDEDCRHRRHWPDRLEDRRHTAPGRVNANLPRSRRYLDFRKPRRATAFGKRKLPCGGLDASNLPLAAKGGSKVRFSAHESHSVVIPKRP